MKRSTTGRRVPRWRDLPLFFKLLLPFLALMIVVGASGTFLVVREMTSSAESALDKTLTRGSIDARTKVHDRELYLLESVTLTANLKGMWESLRTRDAGGVEALVRSVRSLKESLDLLVVADPSGRVVAASGVGVGERNWSTDEFVSRALRDPNGRRASGFPVVGGRKLIAVAGAICGAPAGCDAAGVTIAGIWVEDLAAEAFLAAAVPNGGLSMFAADGSVIAVTGRPAAVPPRIAENASVRVAHGRGDLEAVSLYSSFRLGGEVAGAFAVTVPSRATFDGVRRAGIRLAMIVMAAMLGVIALGALLSRSILSQVRPLVATNRALGQGILTARAPIRSNDEIGELARGVNQMAEQLQAGYETLESTVEQRTEQIRRMLRERTEFFASMSHEFRTPLAVILSEADLLLDATPDPEAVASARTIRISGEQLLRVIDTILEIAAAEAGRIEVTPVPVSLPEIVGSLRATIEGLARSAGLEVRFDVPGAVPDVSADPDRLREILLNLVGNAVKYTPEPGRVVIRAASVGDEVEISVADTGIGIPDEVGDRIFEPFFRVAANRPVRGQASSGLGLAHVKGSVEALGGSVRYERNADGGSTFLVRLRSVPRMPPARRRRLATAARSTT